MKSKRSFEQAKFGAGRIGANLLQGKWQGEDAFQDDVALDRSADDVWFRYTLSSVKSERRNSLAYEDSLSVAAAAKCVVEDETATKRGSRLRRCVMPADIAVG